MKVLVVNAGSSSLKVQIISFPKQEVVMKGHVDGIGTNTIIKIDGATLQKKISTHHQALKYVLSHIDEKDIDVIAHRVVHGGELFAKPVKITSSVISKIEQLSKLAPLHNPANVSGIKACKKLFPKTPQVAVFDTAFHQTIPEYAYMYALPFKYYNKYRIRRYGFHGSSHEYVMEKTKKLLNKSSINIISCHLGNGSSVTAIKNNKSIDTSMGFTPISGLIMGTRSGDVDPGIIPFLAQNENLSPQDMDALLNKKSGFLGIDGFSDMRELYTRSNQGDKHAKLAIEMLCYDLAKYIGSYYAILGKFDALVFTGGLGEQAYYVRKKVCEYLTHFGVKIDVKKNKDGAQKISASSSKVKIFVVAAHEELVIAKHAASLLKK